MFAVTCVNTVPTATSASSAPGPAGAAAGNSATAGQRARVVVLPTGERLSVTDPDAAPTVLPDRAGHQPRMTIVRSDKDIYAIPDEAVPFLGTALDASLFDTTRLARLPSEQVPVRVAFTGAATPVPGVTGGYVSDPAAFGAALARRVAADPTTARSAATPFAGVRSIALDAPTATVVQPNFPMVTLTVNTTMPATGTVLGAFAVITNLDDTRRYDKMIEIPPGNTFSVSVPKGHYAVLGNVLTTATDGGDVDHAYFPIVEDAEVNAPEQSVTLDANRATATPTFSVPKPVTMQGGFLNLVSYDGRHDYNQGFLGGFAASFDKSVQILVQPTPAPAHGVLWFIDQQQGKAADPAARYTYDLAQTWQHGIPADLHTDVRAQDVATIVDHFHADGSPRQASFGRGATFYDWPQKLVVVDDYPRPGEVTNYVYGPPSAQWQAFLFQSNAANSAFIQDGSVPVTYRAGRTYRADWLRGPLGPGFGKEAAPSACLACRTGDQLLLTPATTVDGDPDHFGQAGAFASGFARIQVFQDGTRIADAPDANLVMVPVPSEEHTYRIVNDFDLGRLGYQTSTQATTEWTVRSSATSAPPIPKKWWCWLSTTEQCTVLPFLTVAAPVPTSDTDTVAPGRMSFVARVGHVQGSAPSAITSFGFATSLDGTTYTPARVTDLGKGRYRVTVTTPAGAAGQPVSVRMQATDAAGATITETVHNAYTVEGS